MERRIYPKPPIVEAVIEFRFIEGVEKEALLECLASGLDSSYPGEQREQAHIEIEAQVQKDSIESSARRGPSITFLTSEDQLRLVGCGDNVLTIHVLAPYPGWESFVLQAAEVVNALPEKILQAQMRAIGVRYIDRIELPDDSEGSPNDYLTVIPSRPPSMPSYLTGYAFHTHSQDHAEDGSAAIVALVRCTLTAANAGGTVIGLDLNLVQKQGNGPLIDGSWAQVVENLHSRQRDIFEEAITDKMRALFL